MLQRVIEGLVVAILAALAVAALGPLAVREDTIIWRSFEWVEFRLEVGLGDSARRPVEGRHLIITPRCVSGGWRGVRQIGPDIP